MFVYRECKVIVVCLYIVSVKWRSCVFVYRECKVIVVCLYIVSVK